LHGGGLVDFQDRVPPEELTSADEGLPAMQWNKIRIPGILHAGGRKPLRFKYRPEAKSMRRSMRTFTLTFAGLTFFALGSAAQANIAITVDKNSQTMTIAVDGVERYHWPVSTGIPSYETPNGSYRAFRMEEDHYSKEFDDAPMPHSIFFTKIGHAIHGTDYESKLGTPASHGCVRLSKAHAATLYALVEKQGVLNTTVTLTGSSQIALARNPRRNVAVARRDITPDYDQQYDSVGQPMQLTRQPQLYQGRRVPQAQLDDGYIYPADGSSDAARYPAPRSNRRVYDAQAYREPQYQYYNNPNYAPQGYYQARPSYPPSGQFGYQN
jgi:L,D-transpeptidase-like protein